MGEPLIQEAVAVPPPDFPDVRVFARIEGDLVAELISTRYDPHKHTSAALVWVDVSRVAPLPQVGWSYQDGVFAPPPPAPPPPPRTQLTPLEFMGRLTPEESARIAGAAQQNAAVLLWLLQASAASYVDLLDPRTQAGVEALVAAGLLTEARGREILKP